MAWAWSIVFLNTLCNLLPWKFVSGFCESKMTSKGLLCVKVRRFPSHEKKGRAKLDVKTTARQAKRKQLKGQIWSIRDYCDQYLFVKVLAPHLGLLSLSVCASVMFPTAHFLGSLEDLHIWYQNTDVKCSEKGGALACHTPFHLLKYDLALGDCE